MADLAAEADGLSIDDDRRGDSTPWLPPGADAGSDNGLLFGADFDEHFDVPARLQDKSVALVESVNDFHYAMVNDRPRNEFYLEALKSVCTPESHVLEIGTGSGLLAMMAARLGVASVTAVEANCHMAQLARENIEANGLSDKIVVVNALSTEIDASVLPAGRADVLVSEILGTLMLGESALDYVPDARDRLLKEGGAIVPNAGAQFVTLIECADLESITRVTDWGGLQLQRLNVLQDTASLVFTKQYGFRLSSCPSRDMAPRVSIADVDFSEHSPGCLALEARYPITASHDGVIHAAMLSWEVYGNKKGKEIKMTTHPDDPEVTFPRDMQWGQGLQLLEDSEAEGAAEEPRLIRVKAGEKLMLVARFSEDSTVVQCTLERVT